MKTIYHGNGASGNHCRNTFLLPHSFLFIILLLFGGGGSLLAQDEEDFQDRAKPVRFMFGSSMLIDNQTVIVPVPGTFEFDIQHRFGTLRNGFDDFFGLYANSNIRLGFAYVPMENLSVGLGLTKFKNLLDLNAKYALFQQTRTGSIPVSLTYYVNAAFDTRSKDRREQVFNATDRWSFFHQVIIARKVSNWLSVQVAPSLSHYNLIETTRKNDHFALAFGAEVRVSPTLAVIGNFDQPLTKHDQGNPNPNVSLGLQMTTSSHAFQIFMGNYSSIIPQENNVFNRNNYEDGLDENFLIGFNITRLWNF